MDRKITSKIAVGLTAAEISKLGRKKRTDLYHVLGICNGTKEIETDYGPATGLRGNFETQSCLDGTVKQAALYWPPAFVAELINAQLLTGKGQSGFSVQFAMTIGVEPSDEGVMGYAYYVDTLQEADASDPFESLRIAIPEFKAIEDKSGDDTDGDFDEVEEDEKPAKASKKKG